MFWFGAIAKRMPPLVNDSQSKSLRWFLNNPQRFSPESIALGVRIWMLLLMVLGANPLAQEWPVSAGPLLHSLTSVKDWTFDQIREAAAMRKVLLLNNNGFAATAYSPLGSSSTRVQPLVLAALGELLFSSSSSSSQRRQLLLLLHCVLSLVVDAWVAYLLAELARRRSLLLLQSTATKNWEDRWQAQLPPILRAQNRDLFDDLVGYNDKDGDNDNNSNNNTNITQDTPPTGCRIRDIPRAMALLYWCSPVTMVASSIFGCWQNVIFALICMSLLTTTNNNNNANSTSSRRAAAWSSGLYLGLATYLNLHAVVFLLPAALILCEATTATTTIESTKKQERSNVVRHLVLSFVATTTVLHGLALLLIGIDDYSRVFVATHGSVFRLSVSPSLSVVWYFYMLCFTRFRTYFHVFLGGIPYLLLIPLGMRLYRYPGVLIVLLWMIWTVLSPTQTLWGLNIGLCLALLEPRTLVRMRRTHCLVCLCAFPIPVVLYSAAYHMWLGPPGNGEANFVFFQCLAYNVFVAFGLVEFARASLIRDKALRWTERNGPEAVVVLPKDGDDETKESVDAEPPADDQLVTDKKNQ